MESPRRPLLPLAAALAAGGILGSQGFSPALLAALAVGGPAAAALIARARGARPPLWALAVFLLALVRGHLSALPPPLGEVPGAAIRGAREEVWVGTWRGRGRGGSAGRLEALTAGGQGLGHALVLEPEGPAPDEGDLVALLPGSEVLPWPRGPVPGPLGRDGRLVGFSPVRPDELVVLRRDGDRSPWRELTEPARRRLAGLRGRLLGRAAELEERAPEGGLVRAVILGDRGGLGGERVDRFTRTGTRHLLAVSGLHVGLVGALLWALGNALAGLLGSSKPRFRGFLGRTGPALCLLLYAGLAGAAPPVTRAALACVAALLAPSFRGSGGGGRRADPLSLWSAALALECLADPLACRSLSLLLSYVATLAILTTTRPLRGALGRLLGPHPRSRLVPRLIPLLVIGRRAVLLHALGRPLGRGLASGVAASVAASLATLPIIWESFGEVGPIGVLLTPLVIPALGLLILAGGTHLLWPAAPLAGDCALWCARLIESALALADRLPATPTPLPLRPPVAVALACLATLWLVRSRPGGGFGLPGRGVALGWALLLLPHAPAPRDLEVHALDVGHGTATVLRGPGLPALVFDAGSRDRRPIYREALAPLLAKWEVTSVDIVLSHDQLDHASGLSRLVERHRPRLFGGALPARPDVRLPSVRRVDAATGRVRLPVEASPLELGLVRGSEEAGNEGSRSLEVRFGGSRILLSGDAEAHGLRGMLGGGLLDGAEARLLLFPHHGSETRLLAPLLEAVRPHEIWISSGSRPAVAREIARRCVRLRSTFEEGPLALFLRPEDSPWTRSAPPAHPE